MSKSEHIDSLDERLISILGKDARQRSDTLARQLSVSPATITRGLSRLIRTEIIRIVALVDAQKVGFPLTAVIAFDVSHDSLETAVQMLADQPEVKWVSTATGRFDI